MISPKIGSPVSDSTSGGPIMAAFDVLGRRGALRVLWELRGDALTFRAAPGARHRRTRRGWIPADRTGAR
jgi:hypothetical protein